MATIYAVISCLYVNGEVEITNGVQNCRVVPTHPYFNTFEACEDYRARFRKDTKIVQYATGTQQIRFSCRHKEVSTWQR